jgi:hypothetical protein
VVTTGYAFVNSVPYGTVSIDGKEVGGVAWEGQLPVGDREVTVTTSTGDSIRRVLSVTEEGQARLCWDFRASAPCRRR